CEWLHLAASCSGSAARYGGFGREVLRAGQRPPNGCRRGHERRDQMSATTLALSSLEIAVRGGCAALSRTELVRVHAQTHRATRLTPFRTRSDECSVESFRLGRLPYAHRTGHNQHPHRVGDGTTAQQLRRSTQVLDASVRARTEKH